MTPEEIDEMSATELRKAIAYRLGWRKLRSVYRSIEYVVAPEEVAEYAARGWTEVEFVPDGNVPDYPGEMAAAWSLDISNARWEFEEHYAHVTSPVVWARCLSHDAMYTGEAYFEKFDTKAEAYATARCRVWLKSQASEG